VRIPPSMLLSPRLVLLVEEGVFFPCSLCLEMLRRRSLVGSVSGRKSLREYFVFGQWVDLYHFIVRCIVT